MLQNRPLAGEEEKQQVEVLLARCDLAEGLELPVVIPGPGEVPQGGMPPFIWTEEGTVVGFLVLEGWPIPEGTPIVLPEYRRRGVGHALVNAATEECRRRGLRRWLMVDDQASSGSAEFARCVEACYDSSEYRMLLDRAELPARPSAPLPGLEIAATRSVESFSRTLAEAFDDPLDQVLRWVEEQVHVPNVVLLQATVGGQPIGTLRQITVGFDAYLTAVGIVPPFRRKGVGRWVVLNAAHNLLEDGWGKVLIEVDTGNAPAYRLYRECGFRETRTYRFYELRTGL